jgi:alpha-1,2-mannosyltransferase
MDSRTSINTVRQSTTVTTPTLADSRLSRLVHGLIGWLRDFPWLTRQRVTFYSGVLLTAYLVAAIGQLAHSHNLMFESGLCVGGDFVDSYAASIAALKGDPASVYDVHRQHIQQAAVVGGKDFGVLVFSYPPTYLLIVLPLAMLPFVASWVAFETATLAGYLAVLGRIAPFPIGYWLAITFPGVIINFMCGQNGFLTTALIGGGLLALNRWPLLAGFLFGLMAYKPHLAILIPLALIVARQWRAFIATGVSATLFAVTSLAVFGPSTWHAFFANMAITKNIVLDQGGINFLMLQSIFGAARMWGGSINVAYMFQAVLAIFAAFAVVWVWQGNRPFALKAATLTTGCLMVSPYLLQYDLVLLALPTAWLAMEGFEKGFLPYEKVVLVASWILPRISVPITMTARIPIAPIVIIVLMTTILRRSSYREAIDYQPQSFHLAHLETPA